MKKNKPSQTAVRIAMCRARESSKPVSERICYDPYAQYFLPWLYHLVARIPFLIQYLRKKGEQRSPGIFEAIVTRVRYMDDYLYQSIEGGIGQLVILGAGYDTRAYRIKGLQKGVRVFEVDHPATQAVKKKKLKKIFGALPGHVTFVPVRFNSQNLKDKLLGSGYAPELKTVFIWEGVSMYLTAEAVDATLEFVKINSAPGSSIIFDYIPASLVSGPDAPKEGRRLMQHVRQKGEELKFLIEKKEIESFLSARGFTRIVSVNAPDLKDIYFNGVNRSRQISPVLHFASAATGSGCQG